MKSRSKVWRFSTRPFEILLSLGERRGLSSFFRMKRISLVMAAMVAATALVGCRSVREMDSGFQSLFDGKSLAGWDGLPGLWSVQEGAITGRTTKEQPLKNNTFLVYTNGTLDNFELRLRYRIANGNSGIQYRSKLIDPAQYIVGGYQADFEAGKTYSGILYEERGRGILAERGKRTIVRDVNGATKIEVAAVLGDSAEIQRNIRDEQWNDYVVIANGNHLMHFINGRMTADVVDMDMAKGAKSGILALQIHVGPPMIVQFKDIRIKRL